LDPPRADTGVPDVAAADVAVVGVPDPVLAVALTMPMALPPIARAAAPMAMDLVILRENMC
jgi:hypothetical protein